MNRTFTLIAAIALCVSAFSETFADASAIRAELLDYGYKGIFVAANGGDAHACLPNSREAVEKAIDKHAQIVVISLRQKGVDVYLDDKSADFALRDALALCRGKIMVAIANPMPFLKFIKEAADQTNTSKQIILYGIQEPQDGFLFIPIINVESADATSKLQDALLRRPVAVELNFSNDNTPALAKALDLARKSQCRVMFNTTKLGLCGTYVDPSSPIEDIKLVYDPLFEMGASIILSGGIKPLLNMLHPGSVPLLPAGAVPKKIEMPVGYAEIINQPDSVIAVTQVFGDGIKLTGVALQYASDISQADLGDAAFSVAGRTITTVSLSGDINMDASDSEGIYVIIHLSPDDKDASLKAPFPGPHKAAKPLNPQDANGIPPIPIVKEPFKQAFAEVTLPSGQIVTTQKQVNLVVDKFSQKVFVDPKTGRSIDYNIFVPSDISNGEKLPLVLFMEDASCVGPYVKTPLMQGLGAVVWAEPSEQVKRRCIVVAPQYPEVMVDDAGYTSPLVDATARLVADVASAYPVDTDRIYTTGQSMGGMMSMVLLIRYPDLFASAYLVACQWVIDQTAPLARYSYWQMVSANDYTAFPWQNQIMEGLERQGAKVARGLWNAQWDANMWQFAFDEITTDQAQIYYTVFAPGTVFTPGQFEGGASGHMATWRYAYDIEPIRQWVFQHHK